MGRWTVSALRMKAYRGRRQRPSCAMIPLMTRSLAVACVFGLLACQSTKDPTGQGTRGSPGMKGGNGGSGAAGAAGQGTPSGGGGSGNAGNSAAGKGGSASGPAGSGGGGSSGGSAGKGDAGASGSSGAGGEPLRPAPTDAGPLNLPIAPDPQYKDVAPTEGIGAPQSVVKDPRFKDLNGVLWLADKGILLIADPGSGTIFELTPPNQLAVWGTFEGKPSGIALGPTGSIIAAEAGAKDIVKIDLATKKVTIIASKFDGGSFAGPRDLQMARTGDIYFGDSNQESGRVFRVDPSGKATKVGDVQWATAVHLTIDQKTLVVPALFENMHVLLGYPVQVDGSAGASSVWTHPGREGGDGMCVDFAGNVYVPSRGGLEVFKPNGERMKPNAQETDGLPHNCAFGGADGKTLYYTLGDELKSIAMKIPGLPE